MSKDVKKLQQVKGPKKLTETDIALLEHGRLKKELRRLERDNLSLKSQRIADKRLILDLTSKVLNYDSKSIQNDGEILEKRGIADNVQHEDVLRKIRSRLGIVGRFGYNPETYEIITEE